MKKRLTLIKVTFHIPAFLIAPLVWPLLLYRRIRYGYPFRRIPLTRGKYVIVDPEDYSWLRNYNWRLARTHYSFYAVRNRLRSDKKSGFSGLMHRQILNPPPGVLVDHVNYNGLDNRKANLRLATPAQNNRHQRKCTSKAGYSQYKGITWDRRKKRWSATITVYGKAKWLGYFHDEIQAAKAYDEAAKRLHGQFASLNFNK